MGITYEQAKEKLEDSMMRVKGKQIASELMELTFG